jgi:Ca2+-binding RTX toxin-like protein
VRRRVSWVTIIGAVLVMVFAGVALAERVECDGGRCEGTRRADTIVGSDRRDVIIALDGFDDVIALAGKDELRGGGGGDFLSGGNNNDTYYGGDGGDALQDDFGSPGDDVMNGGKSGDIISAEDGDDVLRGGEGSDGSGPGTLNLYGGGGDDVLQGGKGGDTMDGGFGRDRHFGGEGDDLISTTFDEEFGGPDRRDFVDCGPGNDRAIVLPNDRVLANCEDVERRIVISGVTAQEAEAAAEEERQRALERFVAKLEANR